MRAIFVILAAGLACGTFGEVIGQGVWEFLGPGIGYRPDAFFVSKNAIYLGLSEEDRTGLGLYRYRFDQGQWELFAWEGYRILGVTVWGQSDENILLIRYDPGDSDILRSTDGGGTWIGTFSSDFYSSGVSQAPSDTSRVFTHIPVFYSTDGGWSWDEAGGAVPWSSPYDACFNPSDALVAYLTGQSPSGFDSIYKSTNGGASWSQVLTGIGALGINVEREQTNHVMGGTLSFSVQVTANAGANWSMREAPFITRDVYSPPWSPRRFFVAGFDSTQTYYDVWRTEDLGETWLGCGEGLPAPPGQPPESLFSILHLAGHPTQPVLYAALEGSGVWRWQYAGAAAPDASQGPKETRLFAYPVPVWDQLAYGVRLSRQEQVFVRLFDAQGRLVATLQEGVFPAGTHIFRWPKSEGETRPASGVYYLRLDFEESQEQRKIVMAK